MDLLGEDVEDKLQKYEEFNTPVATGVQYIPNQSVTIDEPLADFKTVVPSMNTSWNKYLHTKPVKEDNNWAPVEELPPTPVAVEKPVQPVTIKGGSNAITKSIDALKVDEGSKNFLKVLAGRESSYNPKASLTDNKGRLYTGLYQFGDGALKAVGQTRAEYMNDINKQHEAALKFGEQNIKGLEGYIGKEIKGVKVTKAGMMAAAHLGGRGGLIALLQGKERKDQNGTSTLSYLKMFEN